ncbi:MAG TPA: PQQ-binding-like beta-propeller repeat protein, partial [Bacteroidota bacterium]
CGGLRINRPLMTHPGDWLTFGGDPSRVNRTPARINPPLREVWQYNAQAGISGTPLVKDSVVVVATLHGEIQAVELRTGRRIGYKVLDAPLVGTPVLDKNRVVLALAGSDQSLLMMDLENGRQVWAVDAGPIESSPLLYEEALYVGTLRGTVLAFNKATGEELWKFECGSKEHREPVRSSPSTDGTVLCFGNDDGYLYGLRLQSGELLWKTNTGASVFASPVVLEGLAVVGNLEGTIHAVDIQTGAVRWSYNTGSRVYGAVSASRRVVYSGSADGTLYALDLQTGSLLWTFAAESVINSAPLVAGELVFVGSLDKTLYALETDTGRERWRWAAEGRIKVSPVLWGDYLLITSEDKYITALRPEGVF